MHFYHSIFPINWSFTDSVFFLLHNLDWTILHFISFFFFHFIRYTDVIRFDCLSAQAIWAYAPPLFTRLGRSVQVLFRMCILIETVSSQLPLHCWIFLTICRHQFNRINVNACYNQLNYSTSNTNSIKYIYSFWCGSCAHRWENGGLALFTGDSNWVRARLETAIAEGKL